MTTMATRVEETATAASFTVDTADVVRVLSNAALFADGGRDALPALHAVHCEIVGGTMSAAGTNRYALGTDTCPVMDASADGAAFLLDLDDVRALVKALDTATRKMRFPTSVTVTVDDVSVTWAHAFSGATIRHLPLTAEFPNWRRLIPEDDPGRDGILFTAFTPKYLALFAKVDGGSRTAPVKLRFCGSPTKPTVATVGETFVGLIMPCRIAG